MEIEIKDIKESQYGNRFTAVIKGFGELKGCQYKAGTSSKGTYEFIAPPSHKIVLKDGTDKWISDVYLDKAMGDKLLDAYKAAMGSSVIDDDIPF